MDNEIKVTNKESKIEKDLYSVIKDIFSKWVIHVLNRDLRDRVAFLMFEVIPKIFKDDSCFKEIGKRYETDKETSHDNAIKEFHKNFESVFMTLQQFLNWQEDKTNVFIKEDLRPLLIKLFREIPFKFNFEYW